MRGRPFGFIGTLCAAWICTRVAVLTYAAPVPFIQPVTSSLQNPAQNSLLPNNVSMQNPAGNSEHCCQPANGPRPAIPRLAFFNTTAKVAGGVQSLPQAQKASFPLSSGTGSVQQPALSIPLVAPITAAKGDRVSIYAYSFWRSGAAPLGFAQYGGGQSGLIAAYRLDPRLSLIARATLAHGDTRQREVAAGVRWSPKADIPVSITLERRFRNAGPDVVAAYVAGGRSAVSLPMDFKLDVFGQAGWVSAKDARYFFDVQARAERAVTSDAALPLTAGGGIWTGGQKGIARVDIGPTVGTEIPLGDARIRVNADWRFRVAGNAKPGNGPALTLSTSF